MSIALLLSITAPAFAVEPQVQGSPDLHVETETGVSIDVYIRSDEIGEFFEEYHDGVLVATVRCDETSITTNYTSGTTVVGNAIDFISIDNIDDGEAQGSPTLNITPRAGAYIGRANYSAWSGLESATNVWISVSVESGTTVTSSYQPGSTAMVLAAWVGAVASVLGLANSVATALVGELIVSSRLVDALTATGLAGFIAAETFAGLNCQKTEYTMTGTASTGVTKSLWGAHYNITEPGNSFGNIYYHGYCPGRMSDVPYDMFYEFFSYSEFNFLGWTY